MSVPSLPRKRADPLNSGISQRRLDFILSPRGPEGEGRVRGPAEQICGIAHLTLPSLRDGPLPLPPKGRRGAIAVRPQLSITPF